MLDDGAAGLWWIKRFGGTAVVQDPQETPFSEMPTAALEYADVDYVVGVSQMAPLLIRLTQDEMGRETDSRAEAS